MVNATKTNRKLSNELFPEPLPVWTGPRLHDDDLRVMLEDGTVCHAISDDSGACPSAWTLCTTAVAMDAGDNEVRRVNAADGNTNGMARPEVRRTSISLSVVPADGTIVGYYDEPRR